MVALPYQSSQSGTRITVNDWVVDPTRIPAYVLSLADQGFLADAVLRPGGDAPAGVVRFEETTPLYADGTILQRAEGAEVPIIAGSQGQPNVAYSKDFAARILVTDEMRRRNQVDRLNRSMVQLANSMVKIWDDMLIAAVLANTNIQSQAASALWSIGTTDIRGDVLKSAELIEGALDSQGSELGYEADTLIVNRTTKFDIIASDQFAKVYETGGNLASENLRYTGKLPVKIMDFDVLFSPRVPAGVALLMQRKRCGFICDEVPRRMFDMEEDRNRLSFSSILQRVSAVGLDEPKTVVKITGVSA